jgi:DNA-binding CsgD family transcriptional regulator
MDLGSRLMDDTTLISQLIGDIYDAALDRSLWPSVLERTCRFVRGTSGAIADDDPVQRDVRLFYEWSHDPHGLDDVLAIGRHEAQGRVHDDLRGRVNLLAPHFRRAIAIGKLIDLHRVEASAFADTLDGLAIAAYLVGETARVIHANTHGDELVRERRILRIQDGRLIAVGAAADRALQDAVTAAAGDIGLGQKGIALPLARAEHENWVAHVLPLAAGTRCRAGATYAATAAVFVRKATLDLTSPVQILAKAYELTPAEMRVLLAFMQAGGVPEVAAVLGVSEPTVKTHMQRIFGKVGVKRQIDLVKLVASYMTPLAPRKAG